ncbi:MAG: pitrilysin family protein [bacterium]
MELLLESTLMDAYPFKHVRWENGLEALLIHNPISPVAAYLTHYSVGSAQETDRQRGLAHFFEHMMFRETETLRDGDFDRIIAESGGVGLNAFTSYDTTAYHVNVPSSKLERVIELEADRMVNLVLSPELIERERGAVLGEIQMYKDMPSEQLWNTVMESAFPAHPYRHPIVGYQEQVAAFEIEDFAAFYRAHYAPNRAFVVIAGQFDEPALLQALERGYGSLEPGLPRPADAPPDPPLAETRRVNIHHDKITTDSLVIVAAAPGMRDPDIPALQALSVLLSGGQSSPLYRRLVLEGLATHASATVLDVDWMLSSPGLFLIEVGMQHGISAEQGERAVDEVLDRIHSEGIAPEEFERTANQVHLSRYTGLRSNMAVARYLGGFGVVCGDPLFGERLAEEMERVTPDQVIDVLERYVRGAPRVVVVQSPSEAAHR